MIQTSQAWKDYSEQHHIFHIKGILTDINGTSLSLTDEDFMMGTVRFSEACSNASTFDIGSVITNSFECTLNNTQGKFDGFVLSGANLSVQFGIIYEDETEEWIDRGIYTLDKPSSLGYTIQIMAYDFMDNLNRLYTGGVTFPIASSDLAEYLCDYCGVTFGSWNLLNDLTIDEFSYNESTTCREVLSWILQVNCGFGRMNPQGELECSWYSSGQWVDGADLDGGTMSPWNTVDSADGGIMQPWSVVADIDGGFAVDYLLEQVAQCTVSTDHIRITGVRVYVPNTVDEYDFSTVGYSGYILAITDNQLVNTYNKETVANAIYRNIKGMSFQVYDASIYGDPSIQTGDIIGFNDYLGKMYYSYITNLSYTLNGLVDISCGAETPDDNGNEYSNPNTAVMSGAVINAYDYIQAKKISADYISAGTIEASVIAKDFKLEGGSINISTNEEKPDWITLNQNTGTGRFTSSTSPTLVGIACDTDYYADFIGNRIVNAGLEVGRWSGQTQIPVLTADALGNVFIDGTGTAKFSGSVTASSFVNSSRIELKENLHKVDSVLDKIKDADILEFNFVDDVKKHIGLAIGGEYNVPEEVIAKDEDGEEQGVDLYSMVSMAWKAIQEQQTILEELEQRIEVLEKKLNPIGTIKDIIKGDNDGNTDS